MFLEGKAAHVCISLSHRDGVALCTVSSESAFGCDLESVETRSSAFVSDYYTAEERALIESSGPEEHDQLATLLWSAKESTLKALRLGLSVDTREVCVRLPNTIVTSESWPEPLPLARHRADVLHWRPLAASHAGTQSFDGWWRREKHLIRTIICAA